LKPNEASIRWEAEDKAAKTNDNGVQQRYPRDYDYDNQCRDQEPVP